MSKKKTVSNKNKEPEQESAPPSFETEQFATVCVNRKLEPFVGAFTDNEQNATKQKNGQFFGIIQVDDHSDRSSYLPNLLIQVTKKEFYRSRNRDLEENFEAALHKANSALSDLAENGIVQWVGNLNAVIGALKDNQLIFAVTGQATILLVRDRHLINIGKNLADEETPSPVKTFSNISSGDLQAGDKIILLNSSALEIITEEELGRHIQTFPPDEFDNLLKSTLAAEGECESLVVLDLKEKIKPTKKLSRSSRLDKKNTDTNYFGASPKEEIEKINKKTNCVPARKDTGNKTQLKKKPTKAKEGKFASVDTERVHNELLVAPAITGSGLTTKTSTRKRVVEKSTKPLLGKPPKELSPFEEQPEIFIKEEDSFEMEFTQSKKKGGRKISHTLENLVSKVKPSKKTIESSGKPKPKDQAGSSKIEVQTEPSGPKPAPGKIISKQNQVPSDFFAALKVAQAKIKASSTTLATGATVLGKKTLAGSKKVGEKTFSQLNNKKKQFLNWSKKTIDSTGEALRKRKFWGVKMKKSPLNELPKKSNLPAQTELVIEKTPETVKAVEPKTAKAETPRIEALQPRPPREKSVLSNETKIVFESSQKTNEDEIQNKAKEPPLKLQPKPQPRKVPLDGLKKKSTGPDDGPNYDFKDLAPASKALASSAIATQSIEQDKKPDGLNNFFKERSDQLKTKTKTLDKKFDNFWEDTGKEETEKDKAVVENFFDKEKETEKESKKKTKSNSESHSSSKKIQKYSLLALIPIVLIGLVIYLWPESQSQEKAAPEEKEENSTNQEQTATESPAEQTMPSQLATEETKATELGKIKKPIDKILLIDENVFIISQAENSLIELKSNGEAEKFELSKDSKAGFLTYLPSLKLILTLGGNEKSFEAFSTVTKKFEAQTIKLPSQIDLIGTGTYLDYTYLLDKAAGQIYRYPRDTGGFGTRKDWLTESLKDKKKENLVGMAVDESIRLAYSDGTVEKYTKGKTEKEKRFDNFSVTQIFTLDGMKNYYLLDSETGKMLQVAKENDEIKKEITDSIFKNTADFAVNKNETEIFIVSENKILRLAIN